MADQVKVVILEHSLEVRVILIGLSADQVERQFRPEAPDVLWAPTSPICARGSRGVCWDDAVAETFFATLKKELVHRSSWPTRQELASEVFEYIEAFYNRRRQHYTLGALADRLRGPVRRARARVKSPGC